MLLRRSLFPTALAIAAELGCFALMARHGDFLQAGEGWRITVLGVAAGLFFWLAAGGLLRAEAAGPRGPSVRRFFWLATLALHLAALPTLPGDDLWRYRWEGRVQLAGFNPYQLAPDAAALVPLRDGEWTQINHQNIPAVYPPLTEGIFAALAAFHLPVLGYKLLFALANLGVIAILRRLLARRGVSPDQAACYAWNPLAVYLSAGAAHFDSLMVLALLGAVLLLDRFRDSACGKVPRSWRTSPAAWGSALLLGASIAIKIVPVVLLPVWMFALGWRRALVVLLPAAVSPLILGAVAYGFPGIPVFDALRNFSAGDLVNDAAWWLADYGAVTLGGAAASVAHRVYSGIAAGVCFSLACWFRRDWRRGVLWVMGAALLLGPAVHAWYVLWILPLAVWRGGAAARPWLVFSISVFGYYLMWEVNHASGKPWEEPLWLRLGIYLPPALAWAWTCWPKNAPRPAPC